MWFSIGKFRLILLIILILAKPSTIYTKTLIMHRFVKFRMKELELQLSVLHKYRAKTNLELWRCYLTKFVLVSVPLWMCAPSTVLGLAVTIDASGQLLELIGIVIDNLLTIEAEPKESRLKFETFPSWLSCV